MHYRERWLSLSHFKVNFVIRILIASDFVIWSSINMVTPIFAIFIADRIEGGSVSAAGIAMMIYFIAKSIFEIPIGIIMDRTKSERDDLYFAIGGTMLIGVVYFLFSFVTNVWELYFLQIFLGIGTAGAWPSWFSIFGRHIDEAKHGFVWSLHDVLLGVGGAAAAGIGAFAVEKFGFGIVFQIIGVLVILGAGLLFLIRKKVYTDGKEAQTTKSGK
ncbi:MAG: MFS transporter [Parcubacteria group bacterium]